MFTIIIRSILIYIVVLFVFRFMGKRQIGQMQPFELVLTLIIADLATIPMSDVTIPVLHGIVPLLTLVIAHFILTLLTRSSIKLGEIVNGKPVILITPDGIDYEVLKSLNLTVDDVFEAIRGCNFFSLDQVAYAIMETTGKVSVIPKSQFAPATCGDLNLELEEATIPITLVSQGRFMEENAKLAKVDYDFVKNLIVKEKIRAIKDILVLTIDSTGKIYLQEKNKSCKIITASLGENKI